MTTLAQDYAIHHHDRGNYTAYFILHFYPLEEKVHAGGLCAHLLLDPDDVKGFPFKLQLANISPAKSHEVMTKYISTSSWLKIKDNNISDLTAEFSVYKKWCSMVIFYLAKLC